MGWHNLVNTEYFSEAANDFYKNGGRYCTAPRGSRDSFDYWEMQHHRCIHGYKVADTWIPGRYYFYLNFFPMYRASTKDQKSNKKTVNKELGFPRFTEMQYEWWRFKHIAWYGGTFMGVTSEGGRHVCCAKTREAGFSYLEAADGVYNYNFIEGSKSYYAASTEQYLTRDGILNKVQEGLDFINTHIPFWKQNRQKKNTLLHQKASFVDGLGTEQGTMSEIMGIVVDNPHKAHPYSEKIFTPQGWKLWKDIKQGDKVFGKTGKEIFVQEIFEQGEQDIYTITFSDGRKVQCTKDHLWEVTFWKPRQKNNMRRNVLVTEVLEMSNLLHKVNRADYKTNKIKVALPQSLELPHKPVPIDPYTLGLLLGDGSLGKSTKNRAYLTMKWCDVDDIKKFIPYHVQREAWGGDIRNSLDIANCKEKLKQLGLFTTRSSTKFIPDNYLYNSKEVRLDILNGLLDTDGSVTKDFGVIEYSTKSKQLADDFMWLVYSLGFGGTKKKKLIKGQLYYRCYIYCKSDETRLFNLSRKKKNIALKSACTRSKFIADYVHIQSIKFSHREKAKCIRVSAEDSLYLIGDLIVTHNTRGKRGRKFTFEEAGSFPKLKQAYEIVLGSMKASDKYCGQISVFGTGGEEGEGIEGLEDMFYNPQAYDMLAFPNIWEGSADSSCGYFVPCWRTNFGFMDDHGNVDIKAALAYDDAEREKRKLSKDYKALDRRKAEFPRIPSEAFQRVHSNGFNHAEIDAQIKRVQSSLAIQGLIRYGKLIRSTSENALGGVEFINMTVHEARPILDFPHKTGDNADLNGCVTIFEKPFIDHSGHVPSGIYQIVFDPYYKDDAEDRTSLFAVYVLKQDNNIDPSFAGLPVASYVGRPQKLRTCYEIMFMLADYYHCTVQGEISGGGKGVVDYAREHRLLHKVEFEPEMIHNREMASNQKNKSYLMNMTTDRKNLGMSYLVDWHTDVRGVDDKGNPILNIHKIYDIPLLKEMKKAGTVNTDRVSALIVGMFMLKENVTKKLVVKKSADSFYNRTLFSGNYESDELTSLY